MGKRIISQRRGKGSSTYRAKPTNNPRISYNTELGRVIDIIRMPTKRTPIAVIRYSNMKGYVPAPEGLNVGDTTDKFIMPLQKIPVGEKVFGIEASPNTGPKFCLSPGSSAIVLSKDGDRVKVKMPSKAEKIFSSNCMAVMGTPAGEGRSERPFMLAGRRYKFMKSISKLYPRSSANKMNAVDHKFGGGGSGTKRPPVSRNAPPGAKVGSIAARRTGRRKR